MDLAAFLETYNATLAGGRDRATSIACASPRRLCRPLNWPRSSVDGAREVVEFAAAVQ